MTDWMGWALAVAVPASVGWLALHGWRQGRSLRDWADRRGLRVEDGCPEGLDGVLAAFESDSRHLRRELDRVCDVVSGDGFRLFRCLETLDLSPWRGGSGPPKTRIAIVFDVPGRGDTLTVVGRDGDVSRSIPPGLRFSDPVVSRRIVSRLPGPPPHPVSVTLREDAERGVAYLLTPSGTVSDAGLDYLVRLADGLRGAGRVEGAGRAARHRVAPGSSARGRGPGRGEVPAAAPSPPGGEAASDPGLRVRRVG